MSVSSGQHIEKKRMKDNVFHAVIMRRLHIPGYSSQLISFSNSLG